MTLLQSDEVARRPGRRRPRLDRPASCCSAAIVAAVVGYLMSRLLAAPFLKLAVAAEQLGRGRFDLDLPRTRIPEARAIASALQTSAGQLQERLAGEEAFAQHASHVLRTPMTGLRLDLEELSTARRTCPRTSARRRRTRWSASTRWTRSPASWWRCRGATASWPAPRSRCATWPPQCAQALGRRPRPARAAADRRDRGRARHDVHAGPDRVRPGHPARRRASGAAAAPCG